MEVDGRQIIHQPWSSVFARLRIEFGFVFSLPYLTPLVCLFLEIVVKIEIVDLDTVNQLCLIP